ncbi:MAG: PfkB family carbohydrate kinase [Verrucomicrobiota bacterium]
MDSAKDNQKYDILGLGVATLDFLQLVKEFPEGEGVQKSSGGSLQGGGPVATALATASRLGARSCLWDRRGDDWVSDQISAELSRFGVVEELRWRSEGHSSSIASVWVRERDGARAICFQPGTAPPLDGRDVPSEFLGRGAILHANGRHPAAWTALAPLAKEYGTKISFDGGAGRFREADRALLKHVDFAIVARQWAEACTGQRDLQEVLFALRRFGPAVVGVTDGDQGSWFLEKNMTSILHIPARRVYPIVDTTGCGDVFHGAFLYGLIQEWELRQIAEFATNMAGENCRCLGGRGNLLTLEQALALPRVN